MDDLLVLPSGKLDYWGTRGWAQRVYHPRLSRANFTTSSVWPVRCPPLGTYIEGLCVCSFPSFACGKNRSRAPLLLSLGAFAASLRLAGFPHIENLHGSRWQILALLVAAWGMAETARCLQRKWSLYHAGVLILLYADLMILAAIVVMLCRLMMRSSPRKACCTVLPLRRVAWAECIKRQPRYGQSGCRLARRLKLESCRRNRCSKDFAILFSAETSSIWQSP